MPHDFPPTPALTAPPGPVAGPSHLPQNATVQPPAQLGPPPVLPVAGPLAIVQPVPLAPVVPPVQVAPQPPLQAPAQHVPPPVRTRKTHVSEAISTILKSLTLPARLKRNKEIEDQNEARAFQTLLHTQDPVAYPDPGSETASFISLEPSELDYLSSPTIPDSIRNIMPFYLLQKLADIKLASNNPTLKRPENLTDSTDNAVVRTAKRRCMSALTLVSRDIEQPTSFNFPQIMFETEDRMPIPLPFFTHKSLRYIINNLAILPTKKIEGDGTFKKGVILDIEKLSKTLREELSLSFGQYGEASSQMYKFQQQRDGDSPDSGETWTHFWHSHFSFFENREDAKEFYDEWKHVELELRRDRWSYNYRYDAPYYSQRYMTAKNNMIQRMKYRDDINQQIAKALEARPRRDFLSGSNSRFAQRPFQEAGGRSSAPAFCVLCADRSHTLPHHPRDKVKFPDGKIIWAKLVNGRLTSPDAREICVKYNIGGPKYCAKDNRHGDNRAHICSFCGAKDHHALSWTCRSKDS